MNFKIKPNFKEAGKVLGNKMKDFTRFLQELDELKINEIREGKDLYFEDTPINPSLIEIITESKEGMSSATENNNFIIINTSLNDELISEGIAREIVSKVQNLRKEKDFEIENRIKLYYNGDSNIEKVFNDFENYIKDETLSVEIIKDEKLENSYNVNDTKVYLDVERI